MYLFNPSSCKIGVDYNIYIVLSTKPSVGNRVRSIKYVVKIEPYTERSNAVESTGSKWGNSREISVYCKGTY